MTQSLVINGKEYLPSNVLAERFSYSSDYLGKLAREEKILGTLIGRQWFIEPESLKLFLAQAEISKRIRQEELRRQRKLERIAHEKKNSAELSRQTEFMALAQSMVIALCGLLIGTMGWVMWDEGLGLSELSQGLHHNAETIARSLAPEVASLEDSIPANVVIAAQKNKAALPEAKKQEPVIYASLPQFPVRTPLSASSSVDLEALLSDEVQMVKDAEGREVVVPVFRGGGSEESYLLVPINTDVE